MSSGGSGAAGDVSVNTGQDDPMADIHAARAVEQERIRALQDMSGRGEDYSDAQKLDRLAAEAEAAADGAESKVDKQRQHLEAAEESAKLLRAEATKARKAADKAK